MFCMSDSAKNECKEGEIPFLVEYSTILNYNDLYSIFFDDFHFKYELSKSLELIRFLIIESFRWSISKSY